MSDFKRIVKMKTGGSVSKAIGAYEKRERKSEDKADIKQDKAIVKKAFAMHDKQEHKGEKTDLSKLKQGGRAKKAQGTVKKFEKASGQYGAKKGPADKKNIQEAKLFKPAFKCGGNVKKYSGEDGSYVTKGIDAVKAAGKKLYENVMGTEEQNRIAQESMDKQATEGSKLAKFFGGKAKTESAPVAKCGGGKMKRGGNVKKYSGENGSYVISDADLEATAAKNNARDRDRGFGLTPTGTVNIPGVGKAKAGDSGIYKKQSDTVDVPGVGKMKKAPAQFRGDAILLKKGGKAKGCK